MNLKHSVISEKEPRWDILGIRKDGREKSVRMGESKQSAPAISNMSMTVMGSVDEIFKSDGQDSKIANLRFIWVEFHLRDSLF